MNNTQQQRQNFLEIVPIDTIGNKEGRIAAPLPTHQSATALTWWPL